MGVDEARHDDVPGGVDDLRVLHGDVWSDGLDDAVDHQDAAAGQVAHGWVHREDVPVLDQHAP